ncbi:DNA-binding protein [Bacillus subtilis]|uniref:DNA-binding protein n=1 Tax=Bacillus TaxID=1386 RepID=UPI0039EFB777
MNRLSVYQTKIECVVINLTVPKLLECINKIKSVLNGQTTREEVSDWAGTYIYADDPEVKNDRVWDMLILLSGIDLKDSPETYLHSTDDLNDWIKQYTE